MLCSRIKLVFPIINLIFRQRERGQKFSTLNMLNKGIGDCDLVCRYTVGGGAASKNVN